MSMHVGQVCGVLVVWIVSPLLKKHILYSMDAMNYTLYHAVLCAVVILLCAYAVAPPAPMQMEPPLFALLVAGASLSVGGSFMLSSLIAAESNPGEVLAVLDASSSILRYVIGALLFSGELTYRKTAGACLIGAGLTLMRHT